MVSYYRSSEQDSPLHQKELVTQVELVAQCSLDEISCIQVSQDSCNTT